MGDMNSGTSFDSFKAYIPNSVITIIDINYYCYWYY